MSKRIKKKGNNWSIDITVDNWLIFLVGMLIGTILGRS